MEKLRIYSCSLTSRRSTNLFVSFFSVIFGKINAKHEYNVYDTLPVCVGRHNEANQQSKQLIDIRYGVRSFKGQLRRREINTLIQGSSTNL